MLATLRPTFGLNQSKARKAACFVLLTISSIGAAHAGVEDCKVAWEQAQAASAQARADFEAQNWTAAISAGELAESRWSDTAYRCEAAAAHEARSNARIARENREKARGNRDVEQCRSDSGPASGAYDAAVSAFANKDWRSAADAFGRASELYQSAARSCEGRGATEALAAAQTAQQNQQSSLNNLASGETRAKRGACVADGDAAVAARREARLATREEKFQVALAKWTRAEQLFGKLAAECQGFSKTSFAKHQQAAVAARMDVLAKEKYAATCTEPLFSAFDVIERIVESAASAGKFQAAVKAFESKLAPLESGCTEYDLEAVSQFRKDLPLLRKEQRCFQMVYEQLTNNGQGARPKSQASNLCLSSVARFALGEDVIPVKPAVGTGKDQKSELDAFTEEELDELSKVFSK